MQFQSSATHYLFQNSAVSTGMIRALLDHKADFNIKNNVRNSLIKSTQYEQQPETNAQNAWTDWQHAAALPVRE